MNKKLLIILLLMSSSLCAHPKNDVEILTTGLEKNIATMYWSAPLMGIIAVTLYMFYVDGGYETNKEDTSKKEREPEFMKNDYNYPYGRIGETDAAVVQPIKRKKIS